MNTRNLVLVLLIAVGLGVAERRWRVPFLQSGVRVIVGMILLQVALRMPGWREYVFAALGAGWVIWGVSDFLRQLKTRRTGES